MMALRGLSVSCCVALLACAPAHAEPAAVKAADMLPQQPLGLRAALSQRTQIVYETSLRAPQRSADISGLREQQRGRFALEFKTKSAVGDVRTGLLRFQLNDAGSLQFRPRRGGVQLSYREQF
jgi:hypothetical protein